MSDLRGEDGMTLPELLIAIIIALDRLARRLLADRGRHAAHRRDPGPRRGLPARPRRDGHDDAPAALPGVPELDDPADGGRRHQHASPSTSTSATARPGLPPELHTITYDPTARTLIERDYVGTGTAPGITYPTTASRVKTLAENVVPYAAIPIFRYFAYNAATPPRPATVLTTPLSTTSLGLVARIELSFRTLPPKAVSTAARGSIVLQDEVYIRAADPNDPAPTPTCA